MTSISWYETLEGKLAMCLAVLLVVAATVLARSQVPVGTGTRANTQTVAVHPGSAPSRVGNLEELPVLNPHELPAALQENKPSEQPLQSQSRQANADQPHNRHETKEQLDDPPPELRQNSPSKKSFLDRLLLR